MKKILSILLLLISINSGMTLAMERKAFKMIQPHKKRDADLILIKQLVLEQGVNVNANR